MNQLCNRRETKRTQTALRLQQCAVQLTLDHGFDGWTIDDLAAAADVSRRTVFNYFDGKADVVLGPVVELDPERVAVFVAGGPSGNLLADVLAMAADVIEEHTSDQEMIATGRNAVLKDARLLGLAHQRFEDISATFVELVRERDGESYNPDRARLLSRLVVTLFDNAAERSVADPSRPFSEHFDAAIRDARDVLA
ncbi:TetR/AcrR family transcriptional regulator [Nocardioides sp. WS12]|uniref:TetR/AcrR family transcriptional regulator n=1 Tax=Nocardioides sp. WS12 TaxID=2486272 RepID=UPI0015FA60F2|nr:TetR/AcrR family transcriptional regulator [Nocardioides sp. WS12]